MVVMAILVMMLMVMVVMMKELMIAPSLCWPPFFSRAYAY